MAQVYLSICDYSLLYEVSPNFKICKSRGFMFSMISKLICGVVCVILLVSIVPSVLRE